MARGTQIKDSAVREIKPPPQTSQTLRPYLQHLYRMYHRPEYLHPDPLEFGHRYRHSADREAVCLIASSLAYGNVRQILRDTEKVLAPMGPAPARWIAHGSDGDVRRLIHGFRHRWTGEEDLYDLLSGMRRVLDRYGSIENCFEAYARGGPDRVLRGLTGLAEELNAPRSFTSLIPDPQSGSACKRLHLYLRWMVRRDGLDLGCWRCIDPRELIVPVDTHMHRIAVELGLTTRRQADLRTAMEITGRFREIEPDDPVRFDFVLTRFGIHPSLNYTNLAAAPS